MLDKEMILGKLDEINTYLKELEAISPEDFEDYQKRTEIRRSCERLLHLLIECTIDTCNIVVKGLELGLPSEEEDLFDKLEKNEIITKDMSDKLKEMKKFRNILVHRYGYIDDEIVYKNLKKNLGDFTQFREEILKTIKKH